MQKVTYAPIKAILYYIALISFSANAKAFESTASSRLIEKDQGVLWVEQGGDGRHPGDLAAALSQQPPYMVIYVSTIDDYEDRAISHALELAEWFEKHPDTPDHVPVVAFKSQYNTHFHIEIMGVHYVHEKHAPTGKMGPQETYRVRENVVLTYRARMKMRENGEYDRLPVKDVTVVRKQD